MSESIDLLTGFVFVATLCVLHKNISQNSTVLKMPLNIPKIQYEIPRLIFSLLKISSCMSKKLIINCSTPSKCLGGPTNILLFHLKIAYEDIFSDRSTIGIDIPRTNTIDQHHIIFFMKNRPILQKKWY